jgi:AcrR family transcriptional regulator
LSSGARVRQTAAERRETLIEAAMAEFALGGYAGTPTEAIAKRAGISHAYLFRLFPTKKELFLACVDRCADRMIALFRDAAAEPAEGETVRQAMGHAYVDMLRDRELLLFQLHSWAASEDPEIRAKTSERYADLRRVITELIGGEELDAVEFMGQGMLLNVATSLGLAPEQWIWLGADRA